MTAPAVWPDPDPGWRVRAGAGLLIHTPMSPERRAAFDKEAERERKAAEFEAEQRREAAIERRWDLQRAGVVAHLVDDVLQSAAVVQDRQDRRDAQREREAAEIMSQPPPRFDRWAAKKAAQDAAARKIIEPASKGDVARLERALTKVKHALSGRSEQASAGTVRESPEEYARNYGSGIRYRNAGVIVRGPY